MLQYQAQQRLQYVPLKGSKSLSIAWCADQTKDDKVEIGCLSKHGVNVQVAVQVFSTKISDDKEPAPCGEPL